MRPVLTSSKFQSTLPREERHVRNNDVPCRDRISIHAPTRGATTEVRIIAILTFISIHAPTRGATRCALRNLNIPTFQSTLPREERPLEESLQNVDFIISIHAPTRGATTCDTNSTDNNLISIHAPTRGATIYWWAICTTR